MYDYTSFGAGRGLSYSVNQNGSVTVTIVTGRRAYPTLLHWQVVPWVDDRMRFDDFDFSVPNQSGKYVGPWETSSLGESYTFPRSNITPPRNVGLATGYYDTFAAWDYSGWQLLGTTNSIADSAGKTFTFVIPPVSQRSMLFIREGVWKKAGDEAWVNANKGTNGRAISGNNVRPEWYQSSGAIGFYQPVVGSTNSWTAPGKWNSTTSSSTTEDQYIASSRGADYLNSFASYASEPFAFLYEGMLCGFAYQQNTRWGVETYESHWVPRFIPVTITSNKSFLREGESATVTISHTSNNVLEFPSELSSGFWGPYQMAQLPGNNTFLEVGGETTITLNPGAINVSGGTLGTLTGTVPALPAGFNPDHDPEGYPVFVNGTISLSGTFTAASSFEGTAQLSMNTSSFGRGVEVLSGKLSSSALYVGSLVPRVSQISSSPAVVSAGGKAAVSIGLSSESKNFTSKSLQVSNGTVSSFRGQGASYGFVVRPPANSVGNMSVVIPANSFTGPSGFKNDQNASLLIPYDTVLPTVQIASNVSALKAGEVANITLTVSEPVSVVANNSANATAAVSVTGGKLDSWSGNGTKFNTLFTPNANFTGSARLSVNANALADATGNPNKAATLTLAVRTSRPTVTITSSRASVGASQTAKLTFTLSAESQNFTASDITVSNGTLTAFTGTGKSYTATFVPSANVVGVATVVVNANAFTDLGGNANLLGQLAKPIQVDTRALVASISSSSTTLSLSGRQRATITVAFNKPPRSFAIPSITLTNASATALKLTGQSYVFVLTPSSVGTASVSIAAGVLEDAYGNKNLAASLTPAITVTT